MTDRNSTSAPPSAPTPTPLHPTPTRVTVTRYASPLDFGVSATGGSQADCFGAIIDRLRAMLRDAGQIDNGALVGAGHAIIDVAQDGEVAV